MKGNLLTNFLKFSYGSWLGLILGILTTMVTTRLLSPDAFGKASMFDLFIQLALIFTVFGTDQSFVRFYYEETRERRGTLLYNSLRLPVFFTIFMALVIMLFYSPITVFLFNNSSFKFAMLLVLGIIAQLLFRYGQLVIRMQQKGNLYSVIQIFQSLFNFLFILIYFYIVGAEYEVLIYSRVWTLSLLTVITIYFGKNLWAFRNKGNRDAKHSQKDILQYGTPFVLTIFISWLFESFDKIALRQWSNFDELGLYAAAMKLVAMVMVLRTTFSTFWTPVAYQKFENQPEDKLFFRNITVVVAFIMFCVSIFSIAGKDIIIALLGNEYKDAANIMPLLVFMPLFYTMSETTVVGINFFKKTKWHIAIASISCLTNIVGNWFLVPIYGAKGAAIATAFSFIIFFTLRTQISQLYYKVNYPLFKIYFMTIVVLCYALISTFNSDGFLVWIGGITSFVFLILIFYKDLLYIVKNYKSLFH